jgi:hypothetical protein
MHKLHYPKAILFTLEASPNFETKLMLCCGPRSRMRLKFEYLGEIQSQIRKDSKIGGKCNQSIRQRRLYLSLHVEENVACFLCR